MATIVTTPASFTLLIPRSLFALTGGIAAKYAHAQHTGRQCQNVPALLRGRALPAHKAACVGSEWRARAADCTHEVDVFEWGPLLTV